MQKNKKQVAAYRLRHKPTGYYYKPAQGRSNLSITGKIYGNKNLIKMPKKILLSVALSIKLGTDTEIITGECDWEIVEL